MLQPSTIWMVVATILLVFEFIGADFGGLLPAAVLALGLSLFTSLVGLPVWLHGLLFAALAVGGVLALRSWTSTQLARVRLRFDADGSGLVRWRGKVWTAHCLDPDQPLERDELAEVVGREGDALLVRRPGEGEG